MPVAVISDPHYHDIHSPIGRGFGGLALRTFADTAASTRVFNESDKALRAVLDVLVRDGIKIVVVVGDLTDDGEEATVRSVRELLDRYSREHGLRFFMTPGNHDLYAIHGRHQGKRFLNADGTSTLVTSNAEEPLGPALARLVNRQMYCAGYAEGLLPLRDYGFFRHRDDLLWESPFGSSDALDDRLYGISSEDGCVTRQMIDASYLVEPVEGLWLLSLDANVFEPKNGAVDPVLESSFHDSTDAGWNAMLKHKRFVLDWAADVASRARQQGKNLLVFSHYPMIDPLAGTFADEILVFKDSSFARRAPRPETVAAGIASGIGVHFSGHLHVNGTVAETCGDGFLVNIAVPSLVGFPAAYKLVDFEGKRMRVETVPLAEVPDYDIAFAGYRREAEVTGIDVSMLDAVTDHGSFLNVHQAAMVRHRYLPKEWPSDLARVVQNLTLGDLGELAGVREGLDADTALKRFPLRSRNGWEAMSVVELVADGYRLRKGRELALPAIARERLACYNLLHERFSSGLWEAESVQARIAAFLRMVHTYADGLPSRNFSIDLSSGEIVATGEPQGSLMLSSSPFSRG